MTEKEQAVMLIDVYSGLLRIDKAEDMPNVKKEVQNQLRIARAKLEALGIVVENLKID